MNGNRARGWTNLKINLKMANDSIIESFAISIFSKA